MRYLKIVILIVFCSLLVEYPVSNLLESTHNEKFPEFTAIAAVDSTNCIGANGKIPWNIPEDFEHYHNTTMGQVQIMGRKNYETSPPIFTKDGFYIILSTTMKKGYIQPNIVVVESIEDLARLYNINTELWEKQNFIIGGGEIYEEFFKLNLIQYAIISHIEGEYGGDTYFPIKYLKDFNSSICKRHKGFVVKKYEKS